MSYSTQVINQEKPDKFVKNCQ